MANPTKIIIAHKYPLDILALSQIINNTLDNTQVITTHCHHELQHYLLQHPDTELLLLDLDIPSNDLAETLDDVVENNPSVAILATSENINDQQMSTLLNYQLSGYFSKKDSKESVSKAVRMALSGNHWFPADIQLSKQKINMHETMRSPLSRQQFRVLQHMGKGLMNKQIADKLSISESTTKVHVSAVLKKLGVKNRTQAVLALREA
ncbi:MAG: response regulator transcription factor [Halopseudomonas sp.]